MTRKKCQICNRNSETDEPYCLACQITLVQIDEILQVYEKAKEINDIDPIIEAAVRELVFIYLQDNRVKALVHFARKIIKILGIGQNDYIDAIDVNQVELNSREFTKSEALSTLVRARIIKLSDRTIRRGPLLENLYNLRRQNFAMISDETSKAVREIYGVLTIAITRDLLDKQAKTGSNFPRTALAILDMLSTKIRDNLSDNDGFSPLISEFQLRHAFSKIRRDQRNYILDKMVGLDVTGENFILRDITKNGYELKDEILKYLEYIRIRFNQRKRELERDHERTRS